MRRSVPSHLSLLSLSPGREEEEEEEEILLYVDNRKQLRVT